jgi:hypothetical protein
LSLSTTASLARLAITTCNLVWGLGFGKAYPKRTPKHGAGWHREVPIASGDGSTIGSSAVACTSFLSDCEISRTHPPPPQHTAHRAPPSYCSYHLWLRVVHRASLVFLVILVGWVQAALSPLSSLSLSLVLLDTVV